jgi:hypothetical protein
MTQKSKKRQAMKCFGCDGTMYVGWANRTLSSNCCLLFCLPCGRKLARPKNWIELCQDSAAKVVRPIKCLTCEKSVTVGAMNTVMKRQMATCRPCMKKMLVKSRWDSWRCRPDALALIKRAEISWFEDYVPGVLIPMGDLKGYSPSQANKLALAPAKKAFMARLEKEGFTPEKWFPSPKDYKPLEAMMKRELADKIKYIMGPSDLAFLEKQARITGQEYADIWVKEADGRMFGENDSAAA